MHWHGRGSNVRCSSGRWGPRKNSATGEGGKYNFAFPSNSDGGAAVINPMIVVAIAAHSCYSCLCEPRRNASRPPSKPKTSFSWVCGRISLCRIEVTFPILGC
eukprot:TRINITY_DN68842_c0_g1_i1.p2 TRINITY_DN68842_c0_g1~~TRINITY_DN68842_c0_g1_i1.p2  ORF type:complete len:103 (+),score=3.75 TRINITY_DN68842_c0_g1_i1:164-472(+)